MLGLGAIGENAIGGARIYLAFSIAAAQGVYTDTGGIGTTLVAVQLSPITGTSIISTTEDVFVTGTITPSTPNMPVTWGWVLTPNDLEHFTITPSGTTLTVSYISDEGFWTASITILDIDNNSTIYSNFGSLPAPATDQEIIKMSTDNTNTKTWGLAVTVTDSLMNVSTANYVIKIEANYSINRDLLATAIGERS